VGVSYVSSTIHEMPYLGRYKNPCFGGGALANALDTSAPNISKFFTVVMA
jgi:hypothetical protein